MSGNRCCPENGTPTLHTAATVNPTEGITYSEARSLMAAKSSPGGFVVATVTNPGSFMATTGITPTGNGYCRDRILRDRTWDGKPYISRPHQFTARDPPGREL